ncbi:MAG: GPW/gp25 family protein [Nanopusillaceae archaeon]
MTQRYNLVERDTYKSVLQNISVILTTPKGTDPHRPDFAMDLDALIDNPTPLSVGRMKAKIVEAIETYEPRVKVKEIKVKHSLFQPGKVDVELLLEIKETGEQLAWSYSLP